VKAAGRERQISELESQVEPQCGNRVLRSWGRNTVWMRHIGSPGLRMIVRFALSQLVPVGSRRCSRRKKARSAKRIWLRCVRTPTCARSDPQPCFQPAMILLDGPGMAGPPLLLLIIHLHHTGCPALRVTVSSDDPKHLPRTL
jgi:hypothetical protein